MVNQKFKALFSFLVLILVIIVIYYVSFRTKFVSVKQPYLPSYEEVVLPSPELLPHKEAVLSSPYKCIADQSTCNKKGRYRSKSVQVLRSIYVSVRTARKSHRTRLAPLLVTWMRTISPDQVSIKLK